MNKIDFLICIVAGAVFAIAIPDRITAFCMSGVFGISYGALKAYLND